MSIYLDSADLADVSAAVRLGFVRGVTTNPSLMRKVTDDPLRHTAELLAHDELEEIYYQPCGAYGSLFDEASAAWSLDPSRVVLKLPATPTGLAVTADLVRRKAQVALTAAQSASAMIVAEAAGAIAVIPYVDRAWRDSRTENDLVGALSRIRRGNTRIIAASVKNVGQFTQAYVDGADAVSAPLAVLEQLLTHPAGLEAEQAFAAEYASVAPVRPAAIA